VLLVAQVAVGVPRDHARAAFNRRRFFKCSGAVARQGPMCLQMGENEGVRAVS
jgi:hypothetical protein